MNMTLVLYLYEEDSTVGYLSHSHLDHTLSPLIKIASRVTRQCISLGVSKQ